MKEPEDSLSRTCFLFQKNNLRFIVIGARACALHGHIRATEDIDFLIAKDRKNIENAISCIREMYPHLQEELTVEDFYTNIVVKILDEPEIDLSISAWTVEYDEALKDLCTVLVEGVDIPYMGLASLIKSKSTARDQDKWDVSVLEEIRKKLQAIDPIA